MTANSGKIEERGINEEISISEELPSNTLSSESVITDINIIYKLQKELPKVNLPHLLQKLHSTPKDCKKLLLEEKLHIIIASMKSSLKEAGNHFNMSPWTIRSWKRRLQQYGLQEIAPRTKRPNFISEKQKRVIHKEILGGMSRLEIVKKYGIKSFQIGLIMRKYGKLPLKGDAIIKDTRTPLQKLEIVKHGEEFGMNAALIKYSITGRQFWQCYRKFGRKVKGGKRIIALNDVKEMLKYTEEHGIEKTFDKYCMSRQMLVYYYKNFGYKLIKGKWLNIQNNIENIENRKRDEAENAKNSDENENYSPRSTRSSLKTLTPHRSFSSIYSSELPLNSTEKFDLSETSSNLEFLDSKNNEENKELDIEDSEGNKLKPNQYMLGTIREIVLFAEENGENETMKNYSISYDTLATYCRIIYLDGVGANAFATV